MKKCKLCIRVIQVFSVLILAVFGFIQTSEAAPILVTSRVGLNGDKFIDWAVLGPEYSGFSNSDNRQAPSNPAGVIATLSESGGDGFLQTRLVPSSWVGNFALGDYVLWTFGVGAIDISFDIPVFGAGAQIMDGYGDFIGYISAFDINNQLLGMFSLPGLATATPDNSAIFLGVLDNTASIKRIEFSTLDLFPDTGPGPAPGLTAINRLDLITQPQPIPEPTTMLLLGSGLLGLAGYGRKKFFKK